MSTSTTPAAAAEATGQIMDATSRAHADMHPGDGRPADALRDEGRDSTRIDVTHLDEEVGVRGRRRRPQTNDRVTCHLNRVVERRGCVREPLRIECGLVRGRLAPFHGQHRQSLGACEEVAVECAEGKEPVRMRRDPRRLGDREQLDEEAGELNDVIMRAPGRRMPIAGADREAKPPIELPGRVEVAHRMDDVIETARHRMNPLTTDG